MSCSILSMRARNMGWQNDTKACFKNPTNFSVDIVTNSVYLVTFKFTVTLEF